MRSLSHCGVRAKRSVTDDFGECLPCTNVERCWMCSFVIRETDVGVVIISVPVACIGGAASRYSISDARHYSGLEDASFTRLGCSPRSVRSGISLRPPALFYTSGSAIRVPLLTPAR